MREILVDLDQFVSLIKLIQYFQELGFDNQYDYMLRLLINKVDQQKDQMLVKDDF